MHLRNKETHLFGRSPDKEDYCGIKGSHKVNANSNSAPSSSVGGCTRMCSRRWHIFVHVRSGVCAITELSVSLWNSPDASTSRVAFSSPDSFFPFYCLLVLSLLPVRGKDLLSDPSATSHLNFSIPALSYFRYQVIPSQRWYCNSEEIIFL